MTVLSAYYDHRPTIDPVGPPWVTQRNPRVRVLAIVKYKKEELVKKCARDMKPKTFAAGTFPITCRLVWKQEEEGEVLEELAELEVVVLEEGGEQYVATFISCFPATEGKGAPNEVVLATPEREVRLPVEKSLGSYPSTEPARSDKAAVCVRPIFGPYGNINQVVTDIIIIIIILIMVTFNSYHNHIQIAQFVAFYSAVLGVSTFR